MTRDNQEETNGRRELREESDAILHEEIGRLPRRFRTAVVLCYLEGRTHEMAAEQLGCPVGTIKSRLATARQKLRWRLTRRGAGPAVIPADLAGSGNWGAFLSLPHHRAPRSGPARRGHAARCSPRVGKDGTGRGCVCGGGLHSCKGQ